MNARVASRKLSSSGIRSTAHRDLRMPRRLVIRLALIWGETLPSYVDRLAELYQVSLRSMLERIGIATGTRELPKGYGILLDSHNVERLVHTTGLSLEQIEGALFRKYEGVTYRLSGDEGELQRVALSEWMFIRGSQFCPRCLAESGGVWQIEWKLPWSFICPKHKIFLYDRCPECGKRPRSRLGRGGRLATPMRCNNTKRPSEACGCVLGKLPSIPASQRFVLAQRVINLKLQRGMERREFSEALSFFGELRSICQLIWNVYELSDFDVNAGAMHDALKSFVQERRRQRKSGAPNYGVICHSMAVFLRAAAIEKGLLLMGFGSQTDALHELNLISARTRAIHAGAAHRLRKAPRWLAEFIRRSGVPCMDLFQKMILDSKDFLAIKRVAYKACHIPQLFPIDDYAPFRRFLCGVPEHMGRRFCSMFALRLLGMNWEEVMRVLNLPSGAGCWAQGLLMRLDSQGVADLFFRELVAWAKRFGACESKVDYQFRRNSLRSFRTISMATWRRVCKESGVSVRRRSPYAAAWLWADCTGGDWRLSPAFEGVHPRSARRYERAVAGTISSVMVGLRNEATRRLSTSRRGADEEDN